MASSKITTKYLLELVSRSFAITIPLLDKNKKLKVEIQYLLARIIDTIEDSNHNIQDKETLISAFIGMLNDISAKANKKECMKDTIIEDEVLAESTANIENKKFNDELENFKKAVINKTINENDKILIENMNIVLKTFSTFSEDIRKTSISYLKEMGYGMIYYQDHPIRTFDDLNDYCYYVAGTVGLYLTDISNSLDKLNVDKEKAKKFGLFLQKVNIIKDAPMDYKENRIFWPLSMFDNENPAPYFEDEAYNELLMRILDTMIINATEDFKDSIEYIMSIDNKKAPGYKQFCIIAALMGYETLKFIKENRETFLKLEERKINKKTTTSIITKAKSGYYTNKKLEDILKKALKTE